MRSGNAFEEAIERIMQAVKLGVVPTGERLPPERELASRLNVSRVTLREAMHALRESGVVVSRRGRHGGSFVTYRPPAPKAGAVKRLRPSDRADLTDALDFRRALEPGAAELAARSEMTFEEHTALRTMLHQVEASDLAAYRQADSRLHLFVAELSRSRSIVSAVADVRVRINDFLDAIPLIPRNLAHANEQHCRIVEAVVAGDAKRARDRMTEHLEATAALLRGFLG